MYCWINSTPCCRKHVYKHVCETGKHVIGTGRHCWGADLREGDTAAVQVGHRHAQQLTPAVQVPHPDLTQPTSCKDVAVLVWEGNIVHAARWRRLQHLCLQLLALQAPVSSACSVEENITLEGISQVCWLPLKR